MKQLDATQATMERAARVVQPSTAGARILADAEAQVTAAALRLGLDASLLTMLTTPERELAVMLPVEMDDGRIEIFKGYRVQHSRLRGPAKGGFRYHPSVDLDEVRGLASLMAWKAALLDLPYGGAKGGVTCEPALLSPGELNRLTRAYARALMPIIGTRVDIPAPDINTNEQTMAVFVDEIERRTGVSDPGIVTGKPIAIGGIPGRGESTGRGVARITLAMLDRLGIQCEAARIVVQGYGKVGSEAVKTLVESGVRIVGISDVSGGLYNPRGLDIYRINQHIQRHPRRLLEGYAGDDAEPITNDQVLTLDCDVLIPAALEGQITGENAAQIRARAIVEGANAPTTREADAILNDRGIIVVPDILANAGGVVVSYFEWLQGLQGNRWGLSEVRARLDEMMRAAFEAVFERSSTLSISPREAAFLIAVERVAEAAQLRGFAPVKESA